MNADYITLEEATRLFPLRRGKPVTVATLRYRIKHGCRGVRLEAFLSGGAWYTTQAAIDRFHAALNAKANSTAPLRRKTSQAAKDYLRKLGINGKENQTQAAKRPRSSAAR